MRKEKVPYPNCTEKTCNKNFSGICIALTDTDFGKRKCPFYKKRGYEENEIDRRG